MSSTNFAYAVIGVQIPISNLFVAGESSMECRDHGVSEGLFCSMCGKRLIEKWEQLPTPAMKRAAKIYKQDSLELFHKMKEKHDDTKNDAPLGIWGTDYGKNYVDLDDEDEVVIGLRILGTPFKGSGTASQYPMADCSLGSVIGTGQIVKGHLEHFGISNKPRLFVFCYA